QGGLAFAEPALLGSQLVLQLVRLALRALHLGAVGLDHVLVVAAHGPARALECHHRLDAADLGLDARQLALLASQVALQPAQLTLTPAQLALALPQLLLGREDLGDRAKHGGDGQGRGESARRRAGPRVRADGHWTPPRANAEPSREPQGARPP